MKTITCNDMAFKKNYNKKYADTLNVSRKKNDFFFFCLFQTFDDFKKKIQMRFLSLVRWHHAQCSSLYFLGSFFLVCCFSFLPFWMFFWFKAGTFLPPVKIPWVWQLMVWYKLFMTLHKLLMVFYKQSNFTGQKWLGDWNKELFWQCQLKCYFYLAVLSKNITLF